MTARFPKTLFVLKTIPQYDKHITKLVINNFSVLIAQRLVSNKIDEKVYFGEEVSNIININVMCVSGCNLHFVQNLNKFQHTLIS